MYSRHFGFTEKPFDITPDPKYLYLNPTHQEILASLMYGIRERRGIITLTGEVGTGKTTLLNAAMEKLPVTTRVAFIFSTNLTFKQMLLTALVKLKILELQQNVSSSEAILLLNEFAVSQLAAGGNVVLIVDEAQNLRQKSLENLRLLSNLETPKHKLVQIVLCGQPELEGLLNHPNLKQLAQRINLRRASQPLNETETYTYIEHRLAVADYKGEQIYDFNSLNLIWQYSLGIPRKINMLCDNSLLIGYALGKKQIDQDIVKEAIRDLNYHSDEQSAGSTNKLFRVKAALL